jgi:hypothetical protein
MQKPLRRARVLVLAGLAVGCFTFVSAPPASAIGPLPADPTAQPQMTYPGAPTTGFLFPGTWIPVPVEMILPTLDPPPLDLPSDPTRPAPSPPRP